MVRLCVIVILSPCAASNNVSGSFDIVLFVLLGDEQVGSGVVTFSFAFTIVVVLVDNDIVCKVTVLSVTCCVDEFVSPFGEVVITVTLVVDVWVDMAEIVEVTSVPFTELAVNPVDVLTLPLEDVNIVVDISVVCNVDVSCVVDIKLVGVIDVEVLAIVVLLHLLFCRIQKIINMHIICVYDDLFHRRCCVRIFYSKSPSTVNNRGSVSRSVRSCSASCSPIRCDRKKQMTSAPTKIISPETQAQWSERPDHWRFKSEIIARSASWESVTTTLPGPG